ncbi:FeoA family protein [Fischerella sp. PCC 9605]|uniref:FeoA family protein n=1 Tax=Fischerella sp. PCC 9605 TaxID=1173024 RepID=UPI00047C226C|nr:FeoA family protein [Fischerella sp. PCC 9605]
MNNSDRSVSRAWQGFTFICNTPKTTLNENLNGSDKTQSDSPVFPLSQAKQGEVVCIVTFNHLDNIDYLSSIGLIPGIEIQIKSCMKSGSVVVAWQDKCLGLGADIAARVMVKKDI